MQLRVALGSLLLVAGIVDVGVLSLRLAPQFASERTTGSVPLLVEAGLQTSAASVTRPMATAGAISPFPTPPQVPAPTQEESSPTSGGTVALPKLPSEEKEGPASLSSSGRTSLEFPDLLFDHDSAELDSADMRVIAVVAQRLKAQPSARVIVRGHSNALGSEAYNRNISSERAERVRTRFIELGVTPERLSFEAVGEAEPVISADPREAMRKSRRVQILWRD